MAGYDFGKLFRPLNWFKNAHEVDASPPAGKDDASALYKLADMAGGYSQADIENDPIYQLELQRADQLYPGGGGGGDGGLGSALASAARQYAYAGPTIEQIQQYGNQGQERIGNLYAQLSSYLQGQQGDVANRYAQATTNSNAAYDEAAKNIAAAQAAAQQNIQQQANTGGSAAQAAAGANKAQVSEAIQRQAALNASNKANAASNLQTLSTGQQGILSNYIAGEQVERGAQSGRFQDAVNNMVLKAQNEMAAAAQRSAAAQSEIRNRYAAAQSEAAGKNAAAKTKAKEDAIKRLEKSGGGGSLSGIRGILSAAMKAGKPELAIKFMNMLGASKQNAADINAKAAADLSGQTKKTTPEDQLQLLLGGVGSSGKINLADNSQDLYRGDLLKQIRENPALDFLRKYIVSTPEQAMQQDAYQAAFGQSKDTYNRMIAREGREQQPKKLVHGVWVSAGPGQTPYSQQMRERFTPFFNIDALRGNQGDINRYYGSFQDSGDAELMNTLYNIFYGKWGKG